MFKIIGFILFDCQANTLAMTRKTAGTAATAAAMNTNMAEVEAVVNALTADNLSADCVTAVKINIDVVRTDYGLAQHTDGSLMVDPSDTNPCIEQGDGGIRVKVDSSSIERASGGLQVKAGGITLAMLASAVQQMNYPVGSIYANRTVATSPATLLGFGTWIAIGGFIAGIDGSAEFLTAGQTGGEKTHTLTSNEMPAHTHSISCDKPTDQGSVVGSAPSGGGFSSSKITGSTGGGAAHNTLPPYTSVYLWYRSA